MNGLKQLLTAIEHDWEIDEPVLCGTMWSSKTNYNIYHFILKHKTLATTSLLSIPTSTDLSAYLTQQNIQVSQLQKSAGESVF
jgi:hypothetical protein